MSIIDKYVVQLSESVYLARSKVMENLAAGEYGLIRIPRHALVTAVYLNVLTIASGEGVGDTSTLIVGHVGSGITADPDGYLDAAAAAVGVAGLKCSLSDTQPQSLGHLFTKNGGITATLVVNDSTYTGKFQVCAQYSLIF